MNVCHRTVRALNLFAARSQVHDWTVEMHRHPKDHRRDRLLVRNQKREVVFKAHFEIWKDAVVLAFTGDVRSDQMHRLIMKDGWDLEGALSAVLACLAVHAVPAKEHLHFLGFPMVAWYEIKSLQARVRKNQDWDFTIPKVVKEAGMLLEARYKALSGDDVRERLEGLRESLQFLISKDVPWSQVKEIWDEEECRFVLES